MTPIDVRPDHLRIVREVLHRHLPVGVKVWVFGSRASWTTKDSSDLDLALDGEAEIPRRSLSALEEAFEDSDLPYTVDVVDLKRIGERFRRIVTKQRAVVLVEGKRADAADSPASALAIESGVERRGARKDDERRGWRQVKIDDLAEKVAMGPFGSSIKVETFTPSGVPIISGQHLHGFRVNDDAKFNFISEEHAGRLRGANVQRGDVIFTHRGNIGQVAYIPVFELVYGRALTANERHGGNVRFKRPSRLARQAIGSRSRCDRRSKGKPGNSHVGSR